MKTIIFAAIMFGLLLIWACSSPPSALPPLKLTGTAQRHILLKTGETIPLQLEMPEVPEYNWYYAVSEDWVISMVEPYDYPAKTSDAKEGYSSAPNKKVFELTGLKPGKVTIRFYQMAPSNASKLNGVEVIYTVEVKTF